jgi:hypothetical protein
LGVQVQVGSFVWERGREGGKKSVVFLSSRRTFKGRKEPCVTLLIAEVVHQHECSWVKGGLCINYERARDEQEQKGQ